MYEKIRSIATGVLPQVVFQERDRFIVGIAVAFGGQRKYDFIRLARLLRRARNELGNNGVLLVVPAITFLFLLVQRAVFKGDDQFLACFVRSNSVNTR